LGASETPSIFRKKEPEQIETKGEIHQEDTVLKEENRESFSEDQLKKTWENFIEERKEKVTEMEQLIFNRELQVRPNDQVAIILRSSLEISILERFEHDLVSYLRKFLKNDLILIEKVVEEEEDDGKKLYTSADKYEYMVKLNPSLKHLKERLGLDFEY
jgi:DNA polymerase-3 subunit gamma/tau